MAKSADKPDPNPRSDPLQRVATRGAIWVTALSAIAVPASYIRTWLLGSFGDAGEVLGFFAALLIFTQAVTTLAVPGGSTVMTSMMPKISEPRTKSQFALNYLLLTAALSVAMGIVVLAIGPLREWTLQNRLITGNLGWLVPLIPLAILAEALMYILSGLMHFRLVALLTQLRLFAVTLVAASAFLFFEGTFRSHAQGILIGTMGGAYLAVAIIGLYALFQAVPCPSLKPALPAGFWRFLGFVHLNTLCTFAYLNIDQILIGAWLGAQELGAYFALLQCASLIVFIPQKVGQVLLASFSQLVASGRHAELALAHRLLCRLVLAMATPLALLLVIFSKQVADLFGEWLLERHYYLALLAFAFYIGALGSINAMLVLSKEKSGLFFANSLALIATQVTASWLLIDKLGAYGVIAGKAASIVVGQVGLWIIRRWHTQEIKLKPDNSHLTGILLVSIALAFATRYEDSSWLPSLTIFLILNLLYMITTGIRPSELLQALKRGRLPHNRSGARN